MKKEEYQGTAKGVREAALSLIPKTDKKLKIADLGCGWGTIGKFLKNRGHEVFFCDKKQLEIENFKKHDLNEGIPYDDGFFDCAFAIEVIEHLEDPWKFLREIHRILKPGGFCIISTPNILNIKSRLMFLSSGYFQWFQPKDLDESEHINPIPFWELFTIAKKVGFRITGLKTNSRVTVEGMENDPYLDKEVPDAIKHGEILILSLTKAVAMGQKNN